MRTDAKVALVAVLIIVVLVIIYFAFHNSSNKTAENNALPSAQPALVESPNLPGSSPVPPALTQTSQTQPGLISLPATTATSMPATMPGMANQAATSMPAPALDQTATTSPAADSNGPIGATADNSSATLALPTSDTGTSSANSGTPNTASNTGSGTTAGNANTNATLYIPPVTSGSTGSSSGSSSHARRHRSRTLTLSAPHSGIYVVRKGDTLASISRRIYGNERMIHALERANPGLDPRRMRIGQKIRLPHHGRVNLAVRHRTSRRHVYASSAHGGHTYVVRAGEDLSGIARKFYHNPAMWKKIYDANRRIIGSSPNKLRAGERIVIPAR
jgi:nucleoid-associated protein YgaU